MVHCQFTVVHKEVWGHWPGMKLLEVVPMGRRLRVGMEFSCSNLHSLPTVLTPPPIFFAEGWILQVWLSLSTNRESIICICRWLHLHRFTVHWSWSQQIYRPYMCITLVDLARARRNPTLHKHCKWQKTFCMWTTWSLMKYDHEVLGVFAGHD